MKTEYYPVHKVGTNKKEDDRLSCCLLSNIIKKVGLALICPITNQEKGYPFEVLLPKNNQVSGVIISDQLKSLDWKVRNAEFILKAPKSIITETIKKVNSLLIV